MVNSEILLQVPDHSFREVINMTSPHALAPGRPKGPSFSQKVNAGLGQALNFGQQIMQQKQAEQQMKKENEAYYQMTGQDISRITNPKTRQDAFSSAMESQHEMQLQRLRGDQAKELQGLKEVSDREERKREVEQSNNILRKLEQDRGLEPGSLQSFGTNVNLAESTSRKKEKTGPDEAQLKKTAQDSFNGMVDILKQGRLGILSKAKSYLGGKTAKDVGEFTSLSGGLESILVDMVSRGTLSNARFKYIKDDLLPRPNDTQEMIRGKLIGLSKLLGLDASALEENAERPPLESFQR